jgi:hypothetical protein
LRAIGQTLATIVLRPTNLSWLPANRGNPTEQCAHGDVTLTIDSMPFVRGEEAEFLTVSAGALFLLRTLSNDHTEAEPVAEASQLFPHCGFTAYAVDGRFPVVVMGCNVGIDLEVVHSAGAVTIQAQEGEKATVTEAQWRDAVAGFVDEVQAFYDASPPRKPVGDPVDDEGWVAFWREWHDRRAAA